MITTSPLKPCFCNSSRIPYDTHITVTVTFMSDNAGTSSLDKAVPALRVAILNEDSSRYDHIAAAPPDEELVKYWYSWTVLAFVNGLFSFIVFLLSIVINKKLREKPFNLYLIYLMIPDFVFSLLCAMTCLLNTINGAYGSHSMCNFQQFYTVFGFSANAWLNFIIAYQLHTILRNSKTGRRYKLPTRRRVIIQAIAVYLWCSFLGSWESTRLIISLFIRSRHLGWHVYL